MNKKVWLSVIKEELGLLDKLATGMAEDEQLSRLEIELAVSRSGMLTKVFEMLLSQVPAQSNSDCGKEDAPALPPKTTTKETDVPAPAEKEVVGQDFRVESPVSPPHPSPLVSPSPSPSVSQSSSPISPPSPSPSVSQSSSPISPPSPNPQVSPSYSPPVPPSPPLPVTPSPLPVEIPEAILPPIIEPVEAELPKSPFFKPEKEEPVDLGLEVKKEESTKYKPTPIKTLREGLNLNDRYLFQRELFGNDKSRLDETIAALDRLDNIQEAVSYLKANFKWVRSEASERFVQLVKRRFSE